MAGAGSVGAKLWPRASAYGARLWNYKAKAFWADVEMDLGTLAFSMLRRGVPTDVIMPEFCVYNKELCFPANASGSSGEIPLY